MEEMEKNIMRHKIYLAGLLHDIGKFWQRADNCDNFHESNILSLNVKNNVSNLSPVTQDGYVKYAHSGYTQQFLEEHSKVFNQFFNDNQDKDDNFINLAIYHHKPETFLQEIIQLADWWSSGIDRQKLYEKHELDKDYRNRPLINIFKNLKVYNFVKDKNQIKDVNTSSNHFHFSLNKLSLSKEVIFSHAETNIGQKAYEDLWNKFIKDFEKIPTNNFRVFADTLYYVLQTYLWCIPASTLKKEVHDSNLFEHSKTAAAIALCLYDYCAEKQITDIKKINEKHRPISLVSIDISGIQSFIYNISSKGAAKALKGRSFYLQLLMDTIINEILYDLDYYRSNVLYSSGGKAYLLLPNTTKVNEGLEKYQEKLEHWLFEKFNGDIYVSIGKVDFFFDKSRQDGEGEKGKKYLINDSNKYCFIGDLWKNALDAASKRKHQRFKNVIQSDENFFEPFGEGGIIEVCDLTGVELNKNNKFKLDDNLFHISVGEQIELGRILKEASFFVWTKSNNYPNAVVEKSCYNFRGTEKSLKVLNSEWFFYTEDKTPSSIDNAVVYTSVQNDFDFLDSISGNSVKAYRFYAGKTEITAFEDLVDKDADFKRLAAFVMDVDNLGKIFIDGFKLKYFVFNTFFHELGKNFSYLLDNIKRKIREYMQIDNLSKDLDNFLEKIFEGEKNKDIRKSLKKELLKELKNRLEKDLHPDKLLFEIEVTFKHIENLTKDEIKFCLINTLSKYELTVIDYSSFSRLSTLSFYLDLFFSGYVNKLKENYSKIMVVYSGGDDLLAVGDWKEVMQFAEEIRNEFYEFVCHRSEISFSAGIHLFPEKYPISKAVDSAKDAEKEAKSYNNSEKGNITILNLPIVWKKKENNEFDKVKQLKNQLVDIYQKNLVNSAFIQKFQTFYEVKKLSEKTGNLSYRWNTAYYLKRYENRYKDKNHGQELVSFLNKMYDDLRVFVNEAKIDLFVSDRNYDLYALAARWAELELRVNKNKKENVNA